MFFRKEAQAVIARLHEERHFSAQSSNLQGRRNTYLLILTSASTGKQYIADTHAEVRKVRAADFAAQQERERQRTVNREGVA